MPINESYRRRVAQLLRILPLVEPEECFALKGGTAINLFIRDMPRFSVDIDLTYLPVEPRPQSLAGIDTAMRRIENRIKKSIAGAHTALSEHEGAVTKVMVTVDGAQVKIETTPVLRGCVFDPQSRDVSPAVEDAFGFATMRLVSFADLYAGKLLAALDRQHPRDLFDVRDLLANEGIGDDLRRAFLVYLISHDRPMAEVLNARRKNLEQSFAREFEGMTPEPVSLDQLLATREEMIEEIVGQMPDQHRRFLISFERGEPDWSILGSPHVSDLPAVRWRQINLDKLTDEKRARLVTELENSLAISGNSKAQ